MAKIKIIQSKAIIGLAVGFLVIIAILVGWLLLKGPFGSTQPEVTKDESVEQSRLAAVDRADEGDIDGALKEYDKAISEQGGDEAKKRELLLHKADLSRQSGRYDVAIDAAKQAEGIKTDATSAQSLAASYELSGDKENAVIYYKKLIELTPEDSAGARYRGVWEAKVKELEQ